MDDLTREFIVESQEGLDRMEGCLTELEARPGDGPLVAEIFRAVHTIKGTTGFLGFRRLEKLAHAGENLLGQVRDGRVEAGQEVISALLALLDGLRAILKSIEIENAEATGDDSAIISRLEALEMREASEPGNQPGNSCQGDPCPDTPCPDTPYLDDPCLGDAILADAILGDPILRDPILRDPILDDAILRDPGTDAPGWLRTKSADCSVRQPAGYSAVATETIPEVAQGPDSAYSEQTARAQRPAGIAVGAAQQAAQSTLRVDKELLNRMMNLVGELVLTRNQIVQATESVAAADSEMTTLARRLDAVTGELREAVMKARMQPVSHVFAKMPRLVRDLAQTLGRKVRLELEGQETELDKGLLGAIRDPLTHAVRNALDHGIEPPEARAAAGKDPEGTLRLRAAHEGSHVIVEVSDDGAGISAEKIRARAVERGLVDGARAAELGERELLQMVFLPGFSTAAAVTSVSGRGVGMDVVRANVEKIGGTVELDGRPGQGTTLRMRIPLTLAIVPALIVQSCGQSFALPQAAIQELVQISPSGSGAGAGPAGSVDPGGAVEWIGNAPFYRLRDNLLPLVFLDRVLEPAGRRRPDPQRRIFVVVLETDGCRYGLAVDGLADPEEIVIKPLSAAVKEIGLFSAATVLGNGELALILDPGAIAARAGVRPGGENRQDKIAGKRGRIANPDNGQDAPAQPCTQPHTQPRTQPGAQREYVLAEAAGQRVAIPLESVERIERVRLGRIEHARKRPVLFEHGHILPIDDPLGALSVVGENPDAMLVIVVCRHGECKSGIAVLRVLAVAAGQPLNDAATGRVAPGATLIDGSVTDIFAFEGRGAALTDARAHWTVA